MPLDGAMPMMSRRWCQDTANSTASAELLLLFLSDSFSLVCLGGYTEPLSLVTGRLFNSDELAIFEDFVGPAWWQRQYYRPAG